MGYEKTLPQNQWIAFFTVLSMGTLFALHFVFTSYFNQVTEQHLQDKVLGIPATEVTALRADEEARLEAANLNAGMRAVASGTRPAAIAPSDSGDVSALEGWALTKNTEAAEAAKRVQATARVRAAEAALAEGTTSGADLAPLRAALEKARAAHSELFGAAAVPVEAAAAPVEEAAAPTEEGEQ